MPNPVKLLLPALAVFLAACGQVWNDPYPLAESGANILYTAFTERPKHLDPAQSYTEEESVFTGQIYQPPLQYHHLRSHLHHGIQMIHRLGDKCDFCSKYLFSPLISQQFSLIFHRSKCLCISWKQA